MATKSVSISDIIVPERHRVPKRIESLSESIQRLGQINAITLSDDMKLIAGGRRLAACKALGMAKIAANVLSIDDIDAELMEIDENLERHELTVLQRGEQLARRKELYEARHPETKQGGDRRSGSNLHNTGLKSFAEDTAAKSGVSANTIQQEVKIAEDLDPEVKDAIRGTDLEDRKVDLVELSRLPKEDQGPVVEEVKKAARKGKQTSVAEVAKELGLGKPKRSKGKLAADNGDATIVGKSRVNGELVDDPPDIAERRRQGKIAPNSIPEVTDPGDGTDLIVVSEEIQEGLAMAEDALSDEDWLSKLPLAKKLDGVPLKTFLGEAIVYRRWERQLKARRVQGTEIWNQIKKKGPFAHRLQRGSAIDPPEKWLKCPKTEDGGCNGEGQIQDMGQCTRCSGKGYWIK